MSDSTSQIDSTIEIVTPENIAFHYRVAGPFRRFPAFFVDMLVRWALVLVIGIACSAAGMVLGGAAIALLFVTYFVLEWFYGGLFETFMNGQTPGKWALGIRVLSLDGQPINGVQAVMRNVLRFADMMPLISLQVFGGPPYYVFPTFVLGLLTMTLSRHFQRFGDLVCGTIVVMEERYWLTGVARIEDQRARELAEYLPLDFRVSRSLARALAAYVDRRRFFSSDRRREVARHLAQPLLERFGFPEDTSYDLLLCALYHRTFVARHPGELPEPDAGGSPFLLAPAPAVVPSESGSTPASSP
jgi:uncharacterized RDD family membrane protein YckC